MLVTCGVAGAETGGVGELVAAVDEGGVAALGGGDAVGGAAVRGSGAALVAAGPGTSAGRDGSTVALGDRGVVGTGETSMRAWSLTAPVVFSAASAIPTASDGPRST